MPDITIDGTSISDLTIDGTDVQEVTKDGDVVWQRGGGGGNGGGGTTTTIIDDFESYGSSSDFHDSWDVPNNYWSLRTNESLEGAQDIISDGGSYADGTYPGFTTQDGNRYTALHVPGTDDSAGLMCHMQSSTDVFDGIRLEVDPRDGHCALYVYDGGNAVNDDVVSAAVDNGYVYHLKIDVTDSSVTGTVDKSDSQYSSSWDFSSETFTQIANFSVSNGASYTSGMPGFYGGRATDTVWDRFTEEPIP